MKKLLSIGFVLAGVLFSGSTIQADVIGDCSLTGYTFMGGSMAYTSTPEYSEKNYFLAQPLSYEDSGANYWGYGWVKFDNLASTRVESAYLVFNLLGIGAMSMTPASESNPADLEIYLPGAIDVADLADSTLRSQLRDNLDGTTSFSGAITMTANGTYSLDITDLYNRWVTGETENNGLVFVSSGSKYASFGNSSGSAPYLSSTLVGTQVPEPATIALLSLGLGFLARRKKA
jgi:hypothetical protein